jgi:hypothetical protein
MEIITEKTITFLRENTFKSVVASNSETGFWSLVRLSGLSENYGLSDGSINNDSVKQKVGYA